MARESYIDMLPHVTKEGARSTELKLSELDEMQTYLSPDKQKVTPELKAQRKARTVKKLGEVLSFMTKG
jgi:hypothetical protein